MKNKERKNKLRIERRKKRSRAKLSGTSDRPRLHVNRGVKNFSAQIIDDTKGITLVSVYTRELDSDTSTKTQKAEKLGKLIAKKALEKKITKVVFDRCGNKYHGRVKAFADSVRANGLQF